MSTWQSIANSFGDFTLLITGTGWFLLKFLFFGGVAFAGTMLGIMYRKNKNAKEQA